MEGQQETQVIPYVQFSVDSLGDEGDGNSSSSSQKDDSTREISFCLEDAVVIDSMMPLIDSESGQMILGGLLGQSSLLEGVQLAALVIDEPMTDSGENQTSYALECDSVSDDTRYLTFSQSSSTGEYNIRGNLCLNQEELSQLVAQQSDAIQSMDQPSVLLTVTTTSTPKETSVIQNNSSVVTQQIEVDQRDPSTDSPNQPGISDSLEPNDVEPPIGKGPFLCTICEKSFVKWVAFKRHKQEHQNDKPFKCSICGNSFNLEINLNLHLMLHEAEESGCLQCKMCPAKFSRLASLKCHLRVHEKDEMCTCEECDDEFPTMTLLQAHIEKHKAKTLMEHKCKLCLKTFSHPSLLKEHSKEHALVRKQLNDLKNSRLKKIRFRKAPATKPGSEALGLFVQSNSQSRLEKKKTRMCTVCGKRFQKPSQLLRHVRIHTGERPYKCTQCDKSFNQKGTLESHVLSMHENFRPFACNLCSCTFSQRGNLKAHTKKVHAPPGENDKSFRCKECCCIFRTLFTLNAHISKAHTHKTAVVVECREVSASTSNSTAQCTKTNTVPIVLPVDQVKGFSEENLTSAQPQPCSSKTHNLPSLSNGAHPIEFAVDSVSGTIGECKFVPEVASDVSILNVHKEKDAKDRWHLCTYCPKSFKKPSDLMRHVRTHTLERPFKCNFCFKAFAVKSTLNTHMLTHTSQKNWKCRFCPNMFATVGSMRAHENIHIGNKTFKCTHAGCDKSFRTSSHRRSHMRIHTRNTQGLTGKRKLLRIGEQTKKVDLPDALKITPDGLVPVPTRIAMSSTAKYPCDLKSRPHRCTICPSAFKKSSHLKQHILSHTGERPYECYLCHRRFVSSGVLKNHIKTHQGIRPYKCDICHIAFTTSGSLKRHKSTHSNTRLYMCPFCKKTFKTNVSCRKHIKIHCNKGNIIALNDNVKTKAAAPNLTARRKNALDIASTSASNENLLSQTPLTIQVSTTNPQTSNSIEPVTVSKISVPVIQEVPSNDNVTIYNDAILTAPPYSNCFGNVERVQSQQICGDFQQVAEYILPETVTFQTPTVPPSTTPTINLSHPTTQIIYNVQLSNALNDQFAPQNIRAPASFVTTQSQPLTVTRIPNPTIIEINSSQVKSGGLVNKVAVTKLGPDRASTTSEIPTINSICLPTTANNASTAIPLSTVIQPTLLRLEEPIGSSVATNQPIILRTESISLEDLATRNSNSNTAPQVKQEAISKPPEPPKSVQVIIPKTEIDEHSSSTKAKQTGPKKKEASVKRKPKVNHCPTCEKIFKKRCDLIRHIRIHTGERPFRCHVCNKSFRVKSTRDSHLRIHEGRKNIPCDVCMSYFSTVSSLKVHMRLHTGSRPYNCSHCNRSFRTTGHLQAHSKTHFKPPKVNKKAKNIQQFTTVTITEPITVVSSGIAEMPHSSSSQVSYKTKDVLVSSAVQDENSVIGDTSIQMGQLTSNSNGIDYLQLLGNLQLPIDSLQNIQISNLDINPIPGDDMLQSYIFITPSAQGTGQEQVPGNQNSSVDTENGDVSLYVPDFSKYNASGSTYAGHSTRLPMDNVYTLDKNLQVDNVETSSMSTPGMKIFQGAINGSDPFLTVASEHCNGKTQTNQASSNSSNRTSVIVTAPTQGPSVEAKSNGNPKQCPDCGRTFSKPSQVVRHRRTHTGEKPEVCTICHNTFSQKSSLNTHMMFTHSDVRRFKCSRCPFQTVQKAALKKHCTRAHPDLGWSELSVDSSATPGINIVSSSNSRATKSATVTTKQINITTGVREYV